MSWRSTGAGRPVSWRWQQVGAAYLVLLGVSFMVRSVRPAAVPPSGLTVDVETVEGSRRLKHSVRVAYHELGTHHSQSVVLLLHGSPGRSGDFGALAPSLAAVHRVVMPDLPGFGRSERSIPDYSIRAHADYALQLMDRLGIADAHVVGYSMGSGVALWMNERAPARIRSLTLLSGLGVQEMELLGSYHPNHVVHGVQLGVLLGVRHLVPHFSRRPSEGLTVEYARNFFDSDQRPLRGMLSRLEAPTLIVHGRRDVLVPYAAAVEHHRLVPHSELVPVDDTHFMVFTGQPAVTTAIGDFLRRVDRGQGIRRREANPARIAAASAPFDPRHYPRAVGITAFVLALGLAIGAGLSVHAAAATSGLLAAQGRVGVGLALAPLLAGALLAAVWTEWRGRRERSHRLAETHRSRAFSLGRRLVSAVLLGTLTTGAGQAAWSAEMLPPGLFPAVALGVLSSVSWWVALTASTRLGRRRLVGVWRRWTRWEFWPPWALYPPVAAYIALLMLRHRSATLFTAANPAIPHGGFIGESKIDILRRLAPSGSVASATLLSLERPPDARVRQAFDFMNDHGLSFPIVLKPDQGQRGTGVAIVKSVHALEQLVRRQVVDMILQAFVPGPEFGVFYYRRPSESRGHIFSITEKRLPELVGDGRHTLEELIWLDERAVSIAEVYRSRFRPRLTDIPQAGERVALTEIGSHCRGAQFLDGCALGTEALVDAVDRVAKHFDGFFFGRFDMRAASVEAFQRGEFAIIELNGVTSEATHIYDPHHSVWTAWRVLCEQWRLAFEIGAENRRQGARTSTLVELVVALGAYRRLTARSTSERRPRATAPARTDLGALRLSSGSADDGRTG